MQQGLWIWMDGAILAPEDARISVLDHGFLYGDSIYETMRTYGGNVFALSEHIERLRASAAAIQLRLPWSDDDIAGTLDEIVAERPVGSEAAVRLVVSRGVGPIGIDPTPCVDPKMIGYAWPMPAGPHPMLESGVAVVVTSIRRNPPGALDPHIKSGNFLNNILAFQDVKDAGAFEGILLTLDGAIAEGTTSNVFWVRDGVIHTPPDEGILLGVTRMKVMAIAEREGIECRLGSYPPEHLKEADEGFITSSLKGVLPIATIDGAPLGDGTVPGLVTAKVVEAYSGVAGE